MCLNIYCMQANISEKNDLQKVFKMRNRCVLLTVIIHMMVSASVFSGNIVVTSSNDSIPGSLRDAVAKAHTGDIILFDKSLTEIVLGAPITIDKSITLSGNPNLAVHDYIHANISGEATYYASTVPRFFEISGTNQLAVVIRNLKFIKNTVIYADTVSFETSGEIILFNNSNPLSTIAINSCSFTTVNKTYGAWRTTRHYYPNGSPMIFNGQNGGAIAQAGGEMTITDCTFTNNVAGGVSYWGAGGAIAQFSGNLLLVNCTFFGNTAWHLDYTGKLGSGSAIYSQNSNLSLINCTCCENMNYFNWNYGQNSWWGNTWTITLYNTVLEVRNSIFFNNGGYDVSGSINSGGFNIFTQNSVSGSVSTDLFNCNPGFIMVNNRVVLDSSTNWIPLCALKTAGCAVNGLPAGGNGAPPYDARGFLRVGLSDIGAYEYNGTSPSVGIAEMKEDLLSIYPNPVTNKLMISHVPVNAVIIILDLKGNTLYTKIATSENETMDVSALAGGVYLVNVIGNKNSEARKFYKTEY